MNHQNNYVGISSIMSVVGIFKRPYDYFDDPIKLFLNLYLAKFLDTSIKPFFPYIDELKIEIVFVRRSHIGLQVVTPMIFPARRHDESNLNPRK